MSRRLGRYELETRLATSATSEVWVAREANAGILAGKLAVKLLWSELAADAGFLEHFLTEAKRAAQLRHPHIVQIRDLCVEDGEYFVVMELVPGESLRDVVTQLAGPRATMPVPIALRVAADAARALHAAHSATDSLGQPLHVLHKGLRPSNLLLGYDGHVKLTDFGTASVLLLPQLVGLKSRVHPLKYAYLSPEQCLHTPLDARSDVFALGVILWETLGGRRLFDQTEEFAVKQAVMQAVVPPPSRLRPGIPAQVDAVVAKALQQNPAARYRTAAEFADALEAAMAALPHRADRSEVGRFLAGVFPDRRARWRDLMASEPVGAGPAPASGTLLRGAGPRPASTRKPTQPRQAVAPSPSPPPGPRPEVQQAPPGEGDKRLGAEAWPRHVEHPDAPPDAAHVAAPKPPPGVGGGLGPGPAAWQDRTVDEPVPADGATPGERPAPAGLAPGSGLTEDRGTGETAPDQDAVDVGATLLTPTEIPRDALRAHPPHAPTSARGSVVASPDPPHDDGPEDATLEDAAAAAGLDPLWDGLRSPASSRGPAPEPRVDAPYAPSPASEAPPPSEPTLPGPSTPTAEPPLGSVRAPSAQQPLAATRGLPEETLDVPPPGAPATGPGGRGPERDHGARAPVPRDQAEPPLGVSQSPPTGEPETRAPGAPTGPPPDGFRPDIFAEDPTPEGPWVPEFRLEDSLAPPPKGAKLGPLTASVLREHGGILVGDASVRAGGRAYVAVQGKLVVKVRGGKQLCEVRVPPEYAGVVERAGGGQESVAGGTTVLLREGDLARLDAGEERFIVRVLRPPAEPRGWDMAVPFRILAVALALSLVMHVVLAVSVGVLQESGVIIPVEKPAPAEKFAQARVRKVKSLKPHKKKKPKPKRRLARKKKPKRVAKRKKAPKLEPKPPDPSEAPARVPNAVRKRISKAMTKRYAGKSRKERVKAIFKTPHAGAATTFKAAVSNVRSVAAKGASSAFRIAGSETHIPGGGVNLAVGGGGEQGPVTKGADAVGGSVAKLKARAKPGGGKVRGRVRGLRAAARVTGTLSRSEVLKVIGRHTRAIQRCYEKELMSKPGLSGKITFAWSITPTGRVSGARQRTSTMGSSRVSNCILKVIRRMKFPKPKGGSVTIVYPFIFRSSS